jgi:probable HAF family extracellular repeat protein
MSDRWDATPSEAADAATAPESGSDEPDTAVSDEPDATVLGDEPDATAITDATIGNDATDADACPLESTGPNCELPRFQWIEHVTATALSGDGNVVVCGRTVESKPQACCWSNSSGVLDLRVPSSDILDTHAVGTNRDGTVIVGYWKTASIFARPFRWTQDRGMIDLGMPPVGPGPGGHAVSVSADGNVVVGASYDADSHFAAFRWSNADGFEWLPGWTGLSWGQVVPHLSADGSVIVGRGDDFGSWALRWTRASGIVKLLERGDWESMADATNGDGSVVVGSTTCCGRSYPTAVRWTDVSRVWDYLGDPPEMPESVAVATSQDGRVVVGQGSGHDPTVQPSRAVIWDAHGVRLASDIVTSLGFDLAGAELDEAIGVSYDGTVIAGNGRAADGSFGAWVLRLP